MAPRSLIQWLVALLSQVALAAGVQSVLGFPSTTTTATSCSAVIGPWNTLPAGPAESQSNVPNMDSSFTVNVQDVCPGYLATNVVESTNGLAANLVLAGGVCNVYGDDIASLELIVQYQSADRLHIEIAPTYIGSDNHSWFVPPENILRAATFDGTHSRESNELEFAWGNTPSFWFKVTRLSDGETLFDTSNTTLVFETQFVEFVTAMPDEYNVYGLGETIHALRLGNDLTRTLWNNGNQDAVDSNVYGSHPIYYDTRYYDGERTYIPWSEADLGGNYTSSTHGVYYRNAHAHEVLLGANTITWRTLGGNIDLYFYAGPTIEQTAIQYQTSTIGLPAMQQYWTFGFHQCRYGYVNWSETEAVVANMEAFQIPLETQWNDIDWMHGVRNFVSDPERYPVAEGLEFLQNLHDSGRHYVHIVDSAIYIPNPDNSSDAYGPYERGHAARAFMLSPDGSEYIGSTWPGYSVFPDWLSDGQGILFDSFESRLMSTGAQDWWTNEISISFQDVTFDGLWIDLSEPYSFCVGSCGSDRLTDNPIGGVITVPVRTTYPEDFCISNATDPACTSGESTAETLMVDGLVKDESGIIAVFAVSTCAAASSTAGLSTVAALATNNLFTRPPQGIRNTVHPPYAINNYGGELAINAVSPDATHQDALKTQEYDAHNLFGYGIVNATYHALLSVMPEKRPFIIGRSTFAGAGNVTGHWGGDNFSQWRYMYWSIPQALSMSLSGIPMFGDDACGFGGNTDEELCNRWMQLSAFFAFYRNHNQIGALSQEPYRWASVIEASKKAMNIRYGLLPYIYTTFYNATVTGSAVVRAMAWEFPAEPLLASADRQFLLGPSLLITPCLQPLAISVAGVFPGSSTGTVWYDWYNQSAITDAVALAGANVTIPAPLGHIPVFVRGGSILPMQPLQDALVIRDVQKHDWTLLVALDRNAAAMGLLYLDDGVSIVQASTLTISLSAVDGCLSTTRTGTFSNMNPLANVTIMGIAKTPARLTFNNEPVTTYSYNTASALLAVTGLHDMTAHGAWSEDWTLCWF